MNKGFTLIELLIVIAIIGILASVVLITFPGATKKAKDSRVVAAISQSRAVFSFDYSQDGNYDSFLCSSTDMAKLCQDIQNNDLNKTATVIGHSPKSTPSTSTCIYAPLNSKTNYWYCADSNGIAGFCSTDPGTTCKDDGTGATCPSDCKG